MTAVDSSQSPLRAARFFAFRTALLPWKVFDHWSEGVSAPLAGDALNDRVALDQALAEDKTLLRARLREQVEQPAIRESLFLASPDLDTALVHWFADPESGKGARVERTLVRYFSRMCGRSTPFGLFAGHSMGRIGPITFVRTEGVAGYQRHTRLDMDYLTALGKALVKDSALRWGLIFRPNSSLYQSGGRLRYAEAHLRGKAMEYHLVAVEKTTYLLDTLKRAENGATLQNLTQALTNEEISIEDAEEFLHNVIESQILLADLDPLVTGPEPIHDLIFQLRTQKDGQKAAWALENVLTGLASIDASHLGVMPERYRDLAKQLEVLPTKVELNRLFQIDLVKSAPEATLGDEVLTEIKIGVELLHKLFGAFTPNSVSRFAEAYQARYESQELPLLEVLDEESGLGFDALQSPSSETSPLLEGLYFPRGMEDTKVPWGGLQSFLLTKILDLKSSGGSVLKLELSEVKSFFQTNLLQLPPSFSVIASVAAADEESLKQGCFQVYLSGISGPSGANLMGRFCHADSNLAEEVIAYLKDEEALSPDALHAEIVHLPEGRIGNVILRPLLRGYEIPYLGRSGAPGDQQIPVTDLLVSVRNGRVVLRSRRLGKEIIPRLTTAHKYSSNSLGVYRFLCMLQHQGIATGLTWNWGGFENQPHLPRVELGRVVLSRARWQITAKEFKPVHEAKGSERWCKLQAWRRERNLPRLILVADNDNKLPVDLDNCLSAENFVEMVKKRPGFLLEEFYPSPEDQVAEGPEGRFVHELLVPFTTIGVAKTPALLECSASALRRSFPPGSEWLYAKIYAGNASVDHLLRIDIGPFVRDLKAKGLIDGWFFIRFGDPDWHLRLRLHGDPGVLWAESMPRLQALLDSQMTRGLVWKGQMDTYVREFERYGDGESMLISERLFQADSEAVMAIMETYSGDIAADARWQLCLVGMDMLLDDLGFSLDGKIALLTRIRTDFLAEFHGQGILERQLGNKFRKERRPLEGLLQGHIPEQLQPGIGILKLRSQTLSGPLQRLMNLATDSRAKLPSLAGSYLHMHANRMLRAAARAQELVLYDFLLRIYESWAARIEKSGQSQPAHQRPTHLLIPRP